MTKKYQKFTLFLLAFLASQALTNYQNACYDGRNPSGWSRKKKLEEFAKGPCSPAIVIPGISGSNLQVVIDCHALENAHPNIFRDTCKWEGCGLFDISPNREYQIWIPAPLTPVSIVNIGKECFSALVKPTYEVSNGKLVLKPLTGVRIKPVGATQDTGTYSASRCGLDGIQNLLPLPIQVRQTEYFKKLNDRLLQMGYEPGLTMQALPYDFRLANSQDPLSEIYGRLLITLSEVTNKKVTIIAHSMGNLRTAEMLWGLTQAERDLHVANFVSVTAPFIGSKTALKSLTCGTEDFSYPFDIGLDYKTYWASVGSFASLFELLPFATYSTQTTQPWFQKIAARIAYEEGRASDPVFSWLPTRDEDCYLRFTNKRCRSGLEVMDDYGKTLEGQPITNNNFLSWLQANSIVTQVEQLWNIRDPRFERIENFGVPLILITSSNVKTEDFYQYKCDPKSFIQRLERFCTASNGGLRITDGPGDGVVSSTSMVTPALKHAIDYEDGVPGAKPVTVIDVCSERNIKTDPFTSQNSSTGEKSFNVNQWVGMPCSCNDRNDDTCSHQGVLGLDKFIDFTANTLQYGFRTQITGNYAQKTDAFYEQWVNSCTLFAGFMGESESLKGDRGENLFFRDAGRAAEKRAEVERKNTKRMF